MAALKLHSFPGDDVLLLIGYLVLSGLAFYGMAIVAHRFVPALCKVSEDMRIPRNVAGATMMAAGASSPELFSNVISVYVTKSDIGVGTIIGSEIFNMMIILSGIAWQKDGPTRIDPAASARDTGSYMLALGLLLLAVSDISRQGSDDDDVHSVVIVRGATTLPMVLGYGVYVFLCSETGRLALVRCFGSCYLPIVDDRKDECEPLLLSSEDDDEDDESGVRKSYEREPSCATACLLCLWPLRGAIRATIPADRPYLSVLTCVLWMSALSYGMVVALEAVAEALGFTTAVVGITISAAGTSWPNLVSSMTAARRGEANMAVSNAFGSNVFNICIALGVPWLLYPAIHNGRNYRGMHDNSIDLFIFFLIFVNVGYIALVTLTRYTLYPSFAFYFTSIYLAFILVAILASKNIGAIENHEQGGN